MKKYITFMLVLLAFVAVISGCAKDKPASCSCPEGYRLDGGACNPECYYSKPACLAPSIQCKTETCGDCPVYSPPGPGFCTDGKIVDGGKNSCGCQMPPKCDRSNNSAVACTMEAKLCPDGSAVGRTGPNCEFAACPTETPNPETHICTAKEKEAEICTMDYNPVCGSDGKTYGNGCGACAAKVDSWTKGECVGETIVQNLCTSEDKARIACTKEYVPVCGWFNESIKCFAYPCAQTFGNKCMACAAANVAYWTEGECPKTGSKP